MFPNQAFWYNFQMWERLSLLVLELRVRKIEKQDNYVPARYYLWNIPHSFSLIIY